MRGAQVPRGVSRWLAAKLGMSYAFLQQYRRRRAAASALRGALTSGAARCWQRSPTLWGRRAMQASEELHVRA